MNTPIDDIELFDIMAVMAEALRGTIGPAIHFQVPAIPSICAACSQTWPCSTEMARRALQRYEGLFV